jgi:large subunit ribosomal protein L29
MNIEKIRNLTEAELAQQERETGEQLFKLKFQLKMGQTESLNKIRTLRKDVARIKTVTREKQLGVDHANGLSAALPEAGNVAPRKNPKAQAEAAPQNKDKVEKKAAKAKSKTKSSGKSGKKVAVKPGKKKTKTKTAKKQEKK